MCWEASLKSTISPAWWCVHHEISGVLTSTGDFGSPWCTSSRWNFGFPRTSWMKTLRCPRLPWRIPPWGAVPAPQGKNRHLCWLSWLSWLVVLLFLPGFFVRNFLGGNLWVLIIFFIKPKKKNTQTQEHNYIINLYLCTPFFSPTGRSFDVFFLNKNGSEQKPKEKVLSQPPPIKKKRSELQKKKLQGKEQTFPFNGTSWDALRMWKMKVCI